MKVRHLMPSGILTLLLTSALWGQQHETFDALLREALDHNPDLAVQRSNVDRNKGIARQAGTVGPPQLTYTRMEVPTLSLGDPASVNIGLMQMVAFPTKLFAESDLAASRVQSAEYDVSRRRVEIAAQVHTALAMLWEAQHRLRILGDMRSLLRQIADAATTRLQVDRASQQEVLTTSIELEDVSASEAVARQDVDAAVAMLRTILGRPAEAPVGTAVLDTLITIDRSADHLVAMAGRVNPLLLRDSIAAVQGELTEHLARQEYLPDITLGIERVVMPRTDMTAWNISAGISLPFAPWTLGRTAGRVQEAVAERSMREADLRASRLRTAGDITGARARLRGLAVRLDALENRILPQSALSVRSSLAEYQTGKSSYLMLLDAARMDLSMRLDAVMTRMNYERELAALAQAVGVLTPAALLAAGE